MPLCFDKVCHAAELAYLFGIETLTTFEFTQGERELSDRMISYWTNYAKYGDPGKTENQVDRFHISATIATKIILFSNSFTIL